MTTRRHSLEATAAFKRSQRNTNWAAADVKACGASESDENAEGGTKEKRL